MPGGTAPPPPDEVAALKQRVAELEATLARAPRAAGGEADDKQLRLLIERSPYCIHRIDQGRKLCSMNRAGLVMMGLDDEREVIGMDYLAAVCDGDRPRIAELLERAYVGESSEFEFTSTTGRFFKSFFIPLTVVAGEVRQLMGLTQDITELKETMSELRRSEELNRRIIEAMPCGLCKVSADGRLLSANATGLEIMGLSQADIEGAATLDFGGKTVFEDGTPCGPADYPVTRALRTGEPQPPMTIGILRPDGQYSWAIYTAVPVRAPETGEVIAAVVAFVDITERKRAEEERQRFEEKLRHAQKLESLGVLAGGIAHDFNNLLVGVLGNAGLAHLELPPDSPVVPLVDQIEEAARRAASLTKQMLAYSGKARREVEALDLSQVTTDIDELMSASIPKLVRVRRALAPDLPAINADATQVGQVVMNLVTNAAESIEGEGTVTLSTGVTEVTSSTPLTTYSQEELAPGSYVYLEVSDTGAGMDAITIARIFDPFYTTKTTGRGLGLSTVLGTVRGHGGAVAIASEPGRGTRFRVLFPASEERSSKVAPAGRRRPLGEYRGTVLLVDDDAAVRLFARRTLERLGLTVLTAADGREGCDVFEANPDRVDFVLLDQVMPRMGGVEALRELRRIRPDIKIILSSGHDRKFTANAFDEGELSGFIEKPYGPEQLERAVEKVLREIAEARSEGK